MKFIRPLILASCLMCLTAGPIMALTAGERWGYDKINRSFTKRIWVTNTANFDAEVYVGAGKLYINNAAITATAAQINAAVAGGTSTVD
ncbi:MAG: hypothetical protein NUV34_05895, partial [Sulfuricaulis sp.]|nr:hypothetical protein [Sulfuricaulis sp.]